jgi:hypothetical protein
VVFLIIFRLNYIAGMLTGRLATDASLVNNLAGSVIGIIL